MAGRAGGDTDRDIAVNPPPDEPEVKPVTLKRESRDSNRVARLCWAMFLPLMAACSTLEVAEGYQVSSESLALRAPIPDGEVEVSIVPKTKLRSFGVLGIPIVPTIIDTSEREALDLRIQLTVRAAHALSFSRQPCLSTDAGDLCPDQVWVHARGQKKDPSGHWSAYPEFSVVDKGEYQSVQLDEEQVLIQDEEIFRLYGYDASQKPWNNLTIELLYRLACDEKCPPQLRLDGDRLLLVDGQALALGPIEFQSTRVTGYGMLEPPQ